MKTIITILSVFTFFFSEKTTAQQHQITASVVNVTSNKGKVYFSLYTKENFRKKPLQTANAIIVDGKSTVVFKNVPKGEYAILCYHDKNDNGTMDFDSYGRPLENYGATNNVMNFGPPQFDNAKFMLKDKNRSFDIRF